MDWIAILMQTNVPTSMHSVRLEATKLTLIGTQTTDRATIVHCQFTRQQKTGKSAGGFSGLCPPVFLLHYDRYHRHRRCRGLGFRFGNDKAAVVIVIEVILTPSHRNVFGFDIQHCES